MTKNITVEQMKEIPVCLDLCKHCTYIENGDFICDETNQLTIRDWNPRICQCTENRRLIRNE